MATAILESILEEGIVNRLLPMSNSHRDALFGGEASFATFSAKINLGLSLGLYGNQTKTDINLIRKIRNEFAHYANRSFAHPEISKHCARITDYRTETEPTMPEVAAVYAKFPRIIFGGDFCMPHLKSDLAFCGNLMRTDVPLLDQRNWPRCGASRGCSQNCNLGRTRRLGPFGNASLPSPLIKPDLRISASGFLTDLMAGR